MNPALRSGHHAPASQATRHHHHRHEVGAPLAKLALLATLHCLAGCAIGEVAGMVIGTALGWSDAWIIALSVLLAFVSGYVLTLLPLLRARLSWRRAVSVALAADTASIAVMEVVDNAVMMLIPGAMSASLVSGLFWGALAAALAIAAVLAYPVNLWLLARGKGHAAVDGFH